MGWVLKALLPSIWFCFRVLPFRQAIRLPILVYRPKFRSLQGRVIINAPVHFGMITMGRNVSAFHYNQGVVLEIMGTLVFQGHSLLGSGTVISIGDKGVATIGDRVSATAGLNLICYNKVSIGERTIMAWDVQIMDHDFHSITYPDGRKSKGYGPVEIGKLCWLANGVKVYKSVRIPDCCIVSADTSLKKIPECGPHSLIAQDTNCIVKATGVFKNPEDDRIQFPDPEL